jgi:hypothetical protein
VLNDMFAMRFNDVAPIVERSPAATPARAKVARRPGSDFVSSG